MTRLERFKTKFKVSYSGCWEWSAGKLSSGYGQFFWGRVDGKDKNIKASRAAWFLLRGSIPDGLMVLHKCDNKACVNPEHLYLGTHADNMRDSVERQRHESGERRYNFVRHPELVERVKHLRFNRRMPVKEIINELGISCQTVYRCLGKQNRAGRRPSDWYGRNATLD